MISEQVSSREKNDDSSKNTCKPTPKKAFQKSKYSYVNCDNEYERNDCKGILDNHNEQHKTIDIKI